MGCYAEWDIVVNPDSRRRLAEKAPGLWNESMAEQSTTGTTRIQRFTEAGVSHASNEDMLCVEPHPEGIDHWVCFLADGQGGRSGGERASRLACERAMEMSLTMTARKLRDPSAWTSLMRTVDQAIHDDPDAGFTTLVGLAVLGDVLVGASCGDSAALVKVGEHEAVILTERQAKNPPVGSGVAIFIPFEVRLDAAWKMLLLSDGAWKSANWNRIITALSEASGPDVIERISFAARLQGTGRFLDDCTIGLLEGFSSG